MFLTLTIPPQALFCLHPRGVVHLTLLGKWMTVMITGYRPATVCLSVRQSWDGELDFAFGASRIGHADSYQDKCRYNLLRTAWNTISPTIHTLLPGRNAQVMGSCSECPADSIVIAMSKYRGRGEIHFTSFSMEVSDMKGFK